MIIGYARISTETQDESYQIEVLKKNGAEKFFVDMASGATMERSGLQKMMKYVRNSDHVIVTELSRLARSTRDLLNIEYELAKMGATISSIFENVDTTTPQRRFSFIICGAAAELERASILARQREGIELAKAQGKYKGRVVEKIDTARFIYVYNRWRAKDISAKKAMEMLGIKPNKFYNSVARYEKTGDPNDNAR